MQRHVDVLQRRDPVYSTCSLAPSLFPPLSDPAYGTRSLAPFLFLSPSLFDPGYGTMHTGRDTPPALHGFTAAAPGATGARDSAPALPRTRQGQKGDLSKVALLPKGDLYIESSPFYQRAAFQRRDPAYGTMRDQHALSSSLSLSLSHYI
jgi:hypothetical protein